MEFDIRRREICKLGAFWFAQALFARKSLAAAPDLYDTLIAGQYANSLRLRQVAGKYLDHDFKLSDARALWVLNLGFYKGRWQDRPVDFKGYWIFNPDGRRCWQAANGRGPKIAYWNQDGRAAGNPEDWELFTFQAVDKNNQTVRIHTTNGGNYVRLVRDTFSLQTQKPAEAAIFVVEFDPKATVSRFSMK
jgi:hypothetical protein